MGLSTCKTENGTVCHVKKIEQDCVPCEKDRIGIYVSCEKDRIEIYVPCEKDRIGKYVTCEKDRIGLCAM